jgi:signal peptidase I
MRRGVNILGWVALALIMGGWFAFLRPPALGGSTELVVVRGTSMRPTYEPGDLVVTRTSDHYTPGQVVAYEAGGGEARVIHRIIAGTSEGFATQGDNRATKDPRTPTAAEITGRAVVRVPRLGTLMVNLSRSPLGMAATAGLAAFLAVIWPDVRHALSSTRLRRAHRRPPHSRVPRPASSGLSAAGRLGLRER